MSAFDQDQPREMHYTITFLRRAVVQPRRGFWDRLFATRNARLDWESVLLAELGARFADQGWPWTTGPWSWYEPDFRIETTADGERVVLFLVSPLREGEEGLIFSEDPRGAPISDEITGRVFSVVRAVLQSRAEVYRLQEYPTGAAWRAAWVAKREALAGSR